MGAGEIESTTINTFRASNSGCDGAQNMPTDDPTPLPKNYRWSADKLTTKEMAILHRLRQQTGKPITHLLRETVLKLKESTSIEAKPQHSTTDENQKE
jgi:hypothetical protein